MLKLMLMPNAQCWQQNEVQPETKSLEIVRTQSKCSDESTPLSFPAPHKTHSDISVFGWWWYPVASHSDDALTSHL